MMVIQAVITRRCHAVGACWRAAGGEQEIRRVQLRVVLQQHREAASARLGF
jgi:hypothetical protein